MTDKLKPTEEALDLLNSWKQSFSAGTHGHSFNIKHFIVLFDKLLEVLAHPSPAEVEFKTRDYQMPKAIGTTPLKQVFPNPDSCGASAEWEDTFRKEYAHSFLSIADFHGAMSFIRSLLAGRKGL